MDQTIGINFQPKNYEATMKVFADIEGGLGKLYQVAERGAGIFTSMKEGIASMKGPTKEVSSGIAEINRELSTLGSTSKKVFGEMGGMIDKTGKTGAATGGKGGAWFGGRLGDMGAAPFILKWKMYSEVLKGAHAIMDDVLMAGARQKIMHDLRDIAVVGFDKSQLMATEEMGRGHVRKWWSTGKQKDYLAAVAEAGSAFDVNAPMFHGKGVEELNKMAQSAMIMGGASKLKGEQASKLLQNLVHAQMGFMKPGELANHEQGMKRVSDLAESSAGKVATVIQKTSIWGPDVGYLLQYALPSALQKGWDIETLLAIGGLGKTTGFKGAQMGRALREIVEGEAGNFAKLMVAGAGDQRNWAMYQRLPGPARKHFVEFMTPHMNKWMGQAPFDFFQNVGKWIDVAEKRGIDPVKGLGISKSWIGIIRTMGQEQFVKDWQEKTGILRQTENTAEAKKLLQGQQQDPGWWKDRLANAWEGFGQSWSQSSPMGKLIGSYVDVLDYATDLNKGAVGWNWSTAFSELKDFAVHGALFGTLQTIVDMSAGLGKLVGILPQNLQPGNVEQLWQDALNLPFKLQSIVDSAGVFFGKLDKILEGPATAFAAAAGAISPRNWDLGTLLPSAAPSGLVPSEDVLSGLMPAGSVPFPPTVAPVPQSPAAAEAAPAAQEERVIRIEVPVELDGREIGRAATEYIDEQSRLAGNVWGSRFGQG